ncbi:hypothetical protein [Thalassobacillus sp. CUG 92003]|uniref:hypothetical protein n=1 Tax=Thalassobacillus sp. CUG 92003 TaxID=2736641 RepID=UPI0015E6ACF6|nr:hypothetical protein [Thalassobacillus sp. CUG 92003]
MAKSVVKFWIAWVFGVVVAVFAISLWRNEPVDWGQIVIMSVAGLIGVLIAPSLKRLLKKGED